MNQASGTAKIVAMIDETTVTIRELVIADKYFDFLNTVKKFLKLKYAPAKISLELSKLKAKSLNIKNELIVGSDIKKKNVRIKGRNFLPCFFPILG